MRPATALAVLLVAVAAGWVASSVATGGAAVAGEVAFVPDGDTVYVVLDGHEQSVRVIGIDTPEVAHNGAAAACFGDAAGRFTRTSLLHHRVSLVPGVERHDRYGRLLAGVVAVDGPLAGRDLAAELASRGLARPLPIPPNDANAARVASLVRDARAARRGLWGACTFTSAFPRAR